MRGFTLFNFGVDRALLASELMDEVLLRCTFKMQGEIISLVKDWSDFTLPRLTIDVSLVTASVFLKQQ